MGLLNFIRRLMSKGEYCEDSNLEMGNQTAQETYIKLEDFLFFSNNMIINNDASSSTTQIRTFITDDISEDDLNVVKEEVKYLMLCLLHFYTYAEVTVNRRILDTSDDEALNHFKAISYYSLERSFLTAFGTFEYTLDKFKNRYAKYTYYLGRYHYQNFERSFLECFAGQLSGLFDDSPSSLNIELKQLMHTARWVYEAYGETTKLMLGKQNFII
jgi:hypothetical protein